MNSVKTIVVVGVLLAVGYWVYHSIHNKDMPPLPTDFPEDWSADVKVEMPEAPSQSVPGTLAGQGASQSTGSPLSPTTVTAQAPVGPSGLAATGDSARSGSGQDAPPPSEAGPEAAAPASHQAEPSPASGLEANSLPPSPAPDPPGWAEAASPPPTSPPRQQDAEVQARFEQFMAAIQRDLDADRLTEALRALSRWYDDPRLTQDQQQRVIDLLDQLAGVVIYSREHRLEPPHVVKAGETLQTIAEQYHVPWELLARINGVQDPEHLLPGQVLKVVRGPFQALVDLDRLEMTLMLGDLYAGRFPIGIGKDEPQLEGSYEVRSKLRYPLYIGPAGTFGSGDPNNPLGDRKLDLNGRIAIHGTNDPQAVGTVGGPGTIRLSPDDIDDVYDILSIGSRVVIRR